MDPKKKTKTIRKARELPFGTKGHDARFRKIRRRDDGRWEVYGQSDFVSTLDLDYPLEIQR